MKRFHIIRDEAIITITRVAYIKQWSKLLVHSFKQLILTTTLSCGYSDFPYVRDDHQGQLVSYFLDI